MSSPGYQVEVRCRIRGAVGQMLHGLPRKARSRAIAVLLGAAAEGVDVPALLASRASLQSVGVLLNQAIRYSHFKGGPDPDLCARVEEAVGIVEALCLVGEKV